MERLHQDRARNFDLGLKVDRFHQTRAAQLVRGPISDDLVHQSSLRLRATSSTSGGSQTQRPRKDDDPGRPGTENFSDDFFNLAADHHSQVFSTTSTSRSAAFQTSRQCQRCLRTVDDNFVVDPTDHNNDHDNHNRADQKSSRQTFSLRTSGLQQEFRQSNSASPSFKASL